MGKLFAAAIIAMICGVPAFGEEQPDARAQAMGNRLLSEINNGIACDTSLIQIKQMLAASQSEAKRLKDKYEPAPATETDPAKP